MMSPWFASASPSAQLLPYAFQYYRMNARGMAALRAELDSFWTGELDQLVVAEPRLHRLEGRIVDPVLAQQGPGELDDLRVFGWDAARMVVADQVFGGSAGGSAGASNPPDVFPSAERQLGQKLQPGLSGYWH